MRKTITLLVVGAMSACSQIPKGPSVDPDEIRVTILLYSGRPNPTFTLERDATFEKLQSLWKGVKANKEFKKETVLGNRLGYNGIVVSLGGKRHGLPRKLHILRSDLEDEARTFYRDDGGLEKHLLEVARMKGALNEEELKFIQEDK